MSHYERGSLCLGGDGPRTPSENNGDSTAHVEGEEQQDLASQLEEVSATQSSNSFSNAANSISIPTKSTAIASTSSALIPREDEHARIQAAEDESQAMGKTAGMAIKHGRKSSVTPKLALDTGRAMGKPQPTPESPVSPRSPVSPKSPKSMSSRLSPMKSLVSPRTGDRGFSLRRSILARNVHGQPKSSGSAIELQSTASSKTQRERIPGSSGSGKKPDPTITIPPAIDQIDDADSHVHSVKKSQGFSALPHYERFIASKTTRTGPAARFRALKERVRKKLLRIQEIPPSKDGRHLDLDPNRKKPLIDDRTGREYISNTISSSRYTLYNFLPRQLFAQFSKLANFYFLCVSILQIIPGLSTTGTYTTLVPLLFFVTISIAKEGYDDLRRYRLDKAENNKIASVLHAEKSTAPSSDNASSQTSISEGPKRCVDTKWHDIRVGDVVMLKRDDAAPADLVVLHSQGTDNNAYVETMALDGETNLKSKHASPPFAKSCRTTSDIAKCNAHLVIEDPNLDLYNFEGKVTVGDETLPLTNNEIIYRGSVLRNTSETIGMVVYTGEECKIRMNATKNPRIKAVSSTAH